MWDEYLRKPEDLFLGMTCTGLLVRNRVLAGWENQNWISLVQNFDKYSADPQTTRALIFGDPIRDDKFRRCLAIANNIYEGRESDIIKGATRACRLNECPEEFANKIVRPKDPTGLSIHPRVAQVGRLSFFK
ncbi:MAG: hypothetical protein ACREQ5_34260 [Candidatus Dormibacteria bacterium]